MSTPKHWRSPTTRWRDSSGGAHQPKPPAPACMKRWPTPVQRQLELPPTTIRTAGGGAVRGVSQHGAQDPGGGAMFRDPEVRLMIGERAKGRSQAQAAARAGMSVRTARTYERRGQLPSQRQQPRRYRTRPNPFEAEWPWITEQLARDPALQ